MPGSDTWQIVPELTPDAAEPLVPKIYGDSFEETELESLLVRARRRETRRRRCADGRVRPLDASRRARPRLRRDARQRRPYDRGSDGVGRAAAGAGDRAHEPLLDGSDRAGPDGRDGRDRRRRLLLGAVVAAAAGALERSNVGALERTLTRRWSASQRPVAAEKPSDQGPRDVDRVDDLGDAARLDVVARVAEGDRRRLRAGRQRQREARACPASGPRVRPEPQPALAREPAVEEPTFLEEPELRRAVGRREREGRRPRRSSARSGSARSWRTPGRAPGR